MGCVSSSFLEDEERIVGGGFGHHIVSLTSTTYGLLTTLDQPAPQFPPPATAAARTPLPSQPPPPPPPPQPTSSIRIPLTPRSEPEVINSWELMAGLDATTPSRSAVLQSRKMVRSPGKENAHRALRFQSCGQAYALREISAITTHLPWQNSFRCYSLEDFEKRCPPDGGQAAVLYTTTLRGIRKTFEDCNAVRAALEGIGVWVRERDVSMDMGFREELRHLMKGSAEGPTLPRLFVRGRHIGGAEAVLRIHEEGGLADLVEGLPRLCTGGVCDGCGGMRFLPCFLCNGSRKVVVATKGLSNEKMAIIGEGKVARCTECNENGLVLCPICS